MNFRGVFLEEEGYKRTLIYLALENNLKQMIKKSFSKKR